MPNMDDIAFFETGPYEHRGGIWSDACRKPHVSTMVPSPPIPDDVRSVASAPLPEKSRLPSGDLASEDLSINDTTPGNGTVVEDTADSSRNNTRRRTWFATVRNEDLVAPDFFPEGQPGESEGSRGRTTESEKSTPPRSQSVPKAESLQVPEPEKERFEGPQFSTHLRPSTSRRSSSQYSLKLEQEEDATPPRTKSTPTTPRKNSDASQVARSPSPPSFFSTLKSKAAAADKQAISNTAKEAMRKWGVNWGGFKKDANNSPLPSEEPSQSGGSPPRVNSLFAEGNSAAHRSRTSYAEVRAAVTERKERERTTSHLEDSPNSTEAQSHPAMARARLVSNPKTTLPNGSVYSDTSINPSTVTSATRLATPKLTPKKSTPSISRVSTEVDTQDLVTSEEAKHAPIHVQPQAKTMSIPGIHASHRGEVQSMGYVAPQLPPSTGPSETMLKNPAIQTVYRLWKTPSTSGQEVVRVAQPHAEQPQATGGQPSEGAGQDEIISTEGADSAPLSNPILAVQPVLKPTPPPLPPRSASIVIRPAPIASKDSPSASQSLKSIAQKDDTIRSQTAIESHPAADLLHQDSVDTITASIDSEPEAMPSPTTDLHPSSNIIHSRPHASSGKTPPALPPRRISTSG